MLHHSIIPGGQPGEGTVMADIALLLEDELWSEWRVWNLAGKQTIPPLDKDVMARDEKDVALAFAKLPSRQRAYISPHRIHNQPPLVNATTHLCAPPPG